MRFVEHWLVFQDHNTIMRSWAVKDFCPDTNQFIQLFQTENKIHVKFAGMKLNKNHTFLIKSKSRSMSS